MDLGTAIKTCRVRRKMTQQFLADSAGISVGYLSMLENNRRDPCLSVVEHIAASLGLPLLMLFFLAADQSELQGADKELAGALARTTLDLLGAIKPNTE